MNSTDIMLRDPTSQGSKTSALPDTPVLSIDTHYASSLNYSTDSEDTMYYTSNKKPSSTLTSYNTILRSSPEYLMNEAASFAVTHSQSLQTRANNRKDSPQSLPSTSATDSTDSYLGDMVISPLPANKKRITQK